MLQSLRKGASTWVVRVFLGILMVSFGIGIWQGNSLFQSGRDTTVAEVGETEIPAQAFQIAFDREVRQLQSQFGGSFTRDQALAFNVQGAVLSQLLSDATVSEAARQFDLRAPKSLIAREIAAIPAFQDISGKFDASRFAQVLYQAGMNEAMLTDQVGREMLRAQLFGPAIGGSRTPTAVAETLYRYRNERRSIDYFAVTPKAAGEIPAPDAAAAEAYYQANPARFTAPEYRGVTILSIEPADVAKTMEPTEQAIAEAYEERLAEFGTEETREVAQIVLPTKEEADAALARLTKGDVFATVAKEAAGSEEADTKLGTLKKADLPAPLGDAVFAAADGAYGGPVETPLGWHVFWIEKVNAGKVTPLADVHDKLRDALALEEAMGQVAGISKSLQDALAGGATLEEAGQSLNLPVIKIAAMDAKGLDPEGKPVTLPAADGLMQNLFQAETGRDGEIMDTAAGGYLVARVDAVTPAALKALDAVKAEVIAGWQADERKKRQQALAEKLAADIDSGKPVEALAASVGTTIGTVGPGLRANDPIFNALPPDLVKSLFGKEQGKAATAAAINGEDIVVGAVRAIETADPAADADGVKAVADKLKPDFAGDLAAVFESDLRRRYGVSVHETVFNSLLGQTTP
ncbi:peptidylprolyl isomerase [Zavarzinia aquatilis]|uniref:Parvulin-like PPIase n=1 Tax=Zavarzinia aquatilis TaxID=2211142 RepID=A0A317EKX1_9PROT|nr:peptidylprolyl isomerase [Zavarzinia aquatilis]PWR25845.1 hypothetical protein DKG74_02520 [Zavarzinia aquatilis]